MSPEEANNFIKQQTDTMKANHWSGFGPYVSSNPFANFIINSLMYGSMGLRFPRPRITPTVNKTAAELFTENPDIKRATHPSNTLYQPTGVGYEAQHLNPIIKNLIGSNK